MFGVGRRRILTGDHVEVWREAPPAGEHAPYFRKRFVAQRGSSAIDWNLREALLILTLDELGSQHLQQFDSTSHTQDRTQRDLLTQHAGPSLQNWLDLPVRREDRRVAHVFHDCAHWFALAHYGLTALRDINRAGVLHLDIKPDNICIPTDVAIYEPYAGGGFRVDLPRLRLIDFAFSLWESKLPLGRALGMGIFEDMEYQSRQLRSAIAAGERGDLEPIHLLDWRADLYGLGWTLQFILADLPALGSEGAPGWDADRLDEAQRLMRQLMSFDEAWRDHPGAALPAPPHQALINRVSSMLEIADLRHSLASPWHIQENEDWRSRELATPLTMPAADLRTPDAELALLEVRPGLDLPTPFHPPQMPHKKPAQWLVLPLLALAVAAYFIILPMLPRMEKQGAPGAVQSVQLPPSSPPAHPAENKPSPSPGASAAPPPGPPSKPAPAAAPSPATAAAPSPSPVPVPQPAPPAKAVAQAPPSAKQRGERLASDLRNASPAQLPFVLSAASMADGESPEIRKAAAEALQTRWRAAPVGSRDRNTNLRALGWLKKQLPQASRQSIASAMGAFYWTMAATEGERDWWKHRADADAEGRAWLAEAVQLAGLGVHQAQHTLAHAYALGLGVPQNSTLAGQRLSQALGGISGESLRAARAWRLAHAPEANHDANPAAADAVIVELAMRLVSRQALSQGDRQFSTAAIPGLRHLADLGEPAAATMLGDIYACRVDPPMKREARLAYGVAKKDPVWAKVIPRRVADVIDGRACSFKMSRQARAQ